MKMISGANSGVRLISHVDDFGVERTGRTLKGCRTCKGLGARGSPMLVAENVPGAEPGALVSQRS